MDDLLVALWGMGTIAGVADQIGVRYMTAWSWFAGIRRPGRASLAKIKAAYPSLAPLVQRAQDETDGHSGIRGPKGH